MPGHLQVMSNWYNPRYRRPVDLNASLTDRRYRPRALCFMAFIPTLWGLAFAVQFKIITYASIGHVSIFAIEVPPVSTELGLCLGLRLHEAL